MGIENREYLRNEHDGGLGLGRVASASIVMKLIGITVGVYIAQLVFPDVEGWLSLSGPDLYQRGQIWRLVTYAFCHARNNPLHLVFNMMILFSIGRVLVSLMGEREFLWFYLTSAVFSGISGVAYYSITKQPTYILGASGAIFAIFCVVTMHYPRQVVQLFGVVPIEMRWLLPLSLVLPMLLDRNGQTAHCVHVGGLLFGFLYFRSAMHLTRWWDQFAGRISMKRRNKGKLRIFAPPTAPESNLDFQVDQILAKISREGEASLTARERNILTQASKQLRKERS